MKRFVSVILILCALFVFLGCAGNSPTDAGEKPVKTEIKQVTALTTPVTTEITPDTTETIPDTTETIPDTTETIPDTTETIPDTTETIPGTSETIPDTTEITPVSTEETPVIHEHYYDEYGFCRDCGEASEERLKNLDDVVCTYCVLYWLVNYDDSPHSDDIKVSFTSIEEQREDGVCLLSGWVRTPFDGRYYSGEFSFRFRWNEESVKFVHEEGNFNGFYVSGEDGGKLFFTFPTPYEFTRYVDGIRVATLVFEHSGAMKQYIYSSYSGSLIRVNDASYSIAYTPIYQEITVTESNGNVSKAYYYPEHKGVIFNDEAYVKV